MAKRDSIVDITKEEPMELNEKGFNKVKELLNKKENNHDYKESFILKNLHGEINLRKVFLAVIKTGPAKISEIFEDAILTKPTCYSQLHKLMEMNLVYRIFVMPIINGTIKNDEIKKKFLEWTEKMPESLKRYYLAKTSYWQITEFGKKFASTAYEFEQEFKKPRDKENG